jgi:hypothetical protein
VVPSYVAGGTRISTARATSDGDTDGWFDDNEIDALRQRQAANLSLYVLLLLLWVQEGAVKIVS